MSNQSACASGPILDPRGDSLVIGCEWLSIDDVFAHECGGQPAEHGSHPDYRALLVRSREAVDRVEANSAKRLGDGSLTIGSF
ncbi:MAG: hypothetical protein AAEJ52_13240 [Myxococcota bacterium]